MYSTRKSLIEPKVVIAIVVIMIGLALFVIYPIIKLLWLVFFPDGLFSLSFLSQIINTHIYMRGFYDSIKVAFWVSVCSVIIGYIFAYAIVRVNVKGKRFFNFMATIPIISPPFLLAMAIILLFGYNGLITKGIFGIGNFRIYGFKGLLLVETIASFPIAYLTLKGVLSAIDPRLEDAALGLGSSRGKVFSTVTLPLSIPGIANAFLIIFTFSLADFGNPILLAGSRFPILSVQAYLEITGMYHLEKGAALAFMLLIPSTIVYIIQKYVVAKKSYVTITGKPTGISFQPYSKAEKILFLSICLVISLLIIGLYSTVLWGAFVKSWLINNSFSLEHLKYAWSQGFEYLKDTLILALISAPIAALQGIIIAFLVVRRNFFGKRSMEFISMLTFALPGTVVGIAYLLSFNTSPLLLAGTAFILIFNFIFRYTPVGVRTGISMLHQLSPSIEEASINLGASTVQTFRKITLPLIIPSFFSAIIYAFIRSMSAISAVVFLVSANWYIYTVFILDELSIGRIENAAAAVIILACVIIAFISAVGFALGKMRGKVPGEETAIIGL